MAKKQQSGKSKTRKHPQPAEPVSIEKPKASSARESAGRAATPKKTAETKQTATPRKAAVPKKVVARKTAAAPDKSAAPKAAPPNPVAAAGAGAPRAERKAAPVAVRAAVGPVRVAARAESRPTPTAPPTAAVAPERPQPVAAAAPTASRWPEMVRGGEVASLPKPSPRASERAADPVNGESGTRVVLLVRDPQCIFAFWNVSDADRERHKIGELRGAAPLILRMHDLGDEDDERAAQGDATFDLTLPAETPRWYVPLPVAGHRWRAELGLVDRYGRFVVLGQSNTIATPRPVEARMPALAGVGASGAAPGLEAGRGEEAAMMSDSIAALLREWSMGEQATASEALIELLGAAPGSGHLAGAHVAGSGMVGARRQEGSPVGFSPAVEAPFSDFWLRVDTELIVYGATQPDARLTVQGRPIPLRPDGTFSLRFALPDGEQVIPVRAVSADEEHERIVTPIVKRRTV